MKKIKAFLHDLFIGPPIEFQTIEELMDEDCESILWLMHNVQTMEGIKVADNLIKNFAEYFEDAPGVESRLGVLQTVYATRRRTIEGTSILEHVRYGREEA